MEVIEIKPEIASVIGKNRTNDTTVHLTKLYNTHTLYNKTQLYLGMIDPSDLPPTMGWIENVTPN